jgi:hypothetical protein
VGESEFNTPESWEIARKYASLLGEVPNSFSSTIRAMLTDFDRTKGLSNGSLYLGTRLVKTPSMLSPLYFATQTFQDMRLDSMSTINAESFFTLYNPIELSAFIGLTYLYRRARKSVHQDEWGQLVAPMSVAVDLGGHVGYSIAAIGPVAGIFAPGMRYLGLSTFLIHDRKGFVDYRRQNKIKGDRFNLSSEMAQWGCTHVQIGSVLVQALGFGVEFAATFARGLSPDTRENPNLDKEAYQFHICDVWIEALLNTGDVPNIVHRGAFYPTKETNGKLIESARQLKAEGSRYSWLDRGKEDISPEQTPQLFSSSAPVATVSDDEAQQIEKALEV